MKNKKMFTIFGAIALGVVMLSATAVAAISGSTGYDTYKSAIKNTIAAKSFTAKVNASVKDNDTLLANVTASMKLDRASKNMSSSLTVTAGKDQKTVQTYRLADKTIVKNSDSDTYEVRTFGNFNFKKKEAKKEVNDPAKQKDVENVIDALAGNLQNYITLNTNSDGTKDVALKLSDNQVSPVINAVTSLVLKNADRTHDIGRDKGELKHLSAFDQSLIDKLPKLVEDIKVNSVDVKATVNKDNFIVNQTVNVVVSGKDAAGKAHSFAISVNVDLTNINSTTPDTIDLKGKKVNEIKPQAFEGKHKRFEQE